MDTITMDITMDITPHHPLVHLECFLEGLDAFQEHHHPLVAFPQGPIMDTTRSTRSTSTTNMVPIMGIIIMARSTQAVPAAVPTQTEGSFCNTSANRLGGRNNVHFFRCGHHPSKKPQICQVYCPFSCNLRSPAWPKRIAQHLEDVC